MSDIINNTVKYEYDIPEDWIAGLENEIKIKEDKEKNKQELNLFVLECYGKISINKIALITGKSKSKIFRVIEKLRMHGLLNG